MRPPHGQWLAKGRTDARATQPGAQQAAPLRTWSVALLCRCSLRFCISTPVRMSFFAALARRTAGGSGPLPCQSLSFRGYPMSHASSSVLFRVIPWLYPFDPSPSTPSVIHTCTQAYVVPRVSGDAGCEAEIPLDFSM